MAVPCQSSAIHNLLYPHSGATTALGKEIAKQKEGETNGTWYKNTSGKTLGIIRGWIQLFIVNLSDSKNDS